MAKYTVNENRSLEELNNATTSQDGLMAANDKTKLNSVAANADDVSFTQTITSGTKIGEISINGTSKNIYTPTITGLPYCRVYYLGNGDTEWSTPPLKWNTVALDTHNAYSTSTGKYTVPIDGIYLVSVNYYSNVVSSGARPTIFHTDSSGNVLHNGSVEHNSQSCVSVNDIFYCHRGDLLYFGPYTSLYPINFYAAGNHNNMAIMMIRPL